MAPTEARTAPSTSTAPPEAIQRTREALLDLLDSIDQEGWEGPAGTDLLQYVRAEMIRPLAVAVGLRSHRAAQADGDGEGSDHLGSDVLEEVGARWSLPALLVDRVEQVEERLAGALDGLGWCCAGGWGGACCSRCHGRLRVSLGHRRRCSGGIAGTMTAARALVSGARVRDDAARVIAWVTG